MSQSEVALETAIQVAGPLKALRRVKDWRDPRGLRYELSSMLALWVAPNIAGHDNSTAVWEWTERLPVGVLCGFGVTGRVPSGRTFRRLAEEGPPGRLDAALSDWITAARCRARQGDGASRLRQEDVEGRAVVQRQGLEATTSGRGGPSGTTSAPPLGQEQVIGGDEIECVKSLVKHVFDTIAADLQGRLLVTADCSALPRAADEIDPRQGPLAVLDQGKPAHRGRQTHRASLARVREPPLDQGEGSRPDRGTRTEDNDTEVTEPGRVRSRPSNSPAQRIG